MNGTYHEAALSAFSQSCTRGHGRACLLSSIIEYNVPTPNAGLQRITLGPDGNYWFTEQNANKIGRINPITHAITEIPLPSGTGPSYVAGDPLGGNSVWFAAPAWNMLVRMNTTTFATSTFTLSTDGLIGGITVGKDPTNPAQEAVWFIASGAINDDGSSSDIVGWLNPLTGSTGRQVIVPATSDPDTGSNGIFTGQDGNIWFGETNSCQITRVNTSSAITQFSLPAGTLPSTSPWAQMAKSGSAISNCPRLRSLALIPQLVPSPSLQCR